MRNCLAVETLPRGQGRTEEINAVAHRLIPLETPLTRNRPCDSPSLGPREESVTPVREKLPQYDGKAEERLPICGLINSLIEDRHLLGRPDLLTAEQRALDDQPCAICRRLMDSPDERVQARGLKQWRLHLKELRRWREL